MQRPLYFALIILFQTFVEASPLLQTISHNEFKNFQGILYKCSPYCEFLSIRESNQWSPDISQVDPKLEIYKLIAKTDPIYPLLIRELPIFPFINKTNGSENNLVGSDNQNRTPSPPKFAVMPFNYGQKYELGLNLFGIKTTSNTSILSKMQNEQIASSIIASYGLMKGQPIFLLSNWILPEFNVSLALPSQFKTDSGVEVKRDWTRLDARIWIPQKKYRHGIFMQYETENFQSKTNSIEQYGSQDTSYNVGWSFQKKEITIDLFTTVMQNLKEEQGFRGSNIESQKYQIQGQTCTSKRNVFDFNLQFCGGAQITISKQSSDLNSEFVQSTSEIQQTKYNIFTSIRMGEVFTK